MKFSEIREKLATQFPATVVQWKPQATTADKKKGMAVAFVDPRFYEDRLNEVCPDDWQVTFEHIPTQQIAVGAERKNPNMMTVMCSLIICDITRCSMGEAELVDANTATSAEAQAFKRACVKFGLGRYLYKLPKSWEEMATNGKGFSPAALARLKKVASQKVTSEDHAEDAPPPPGDAGPAPAAPAGGPWTKPEAIKVTPEQLAAITAIKQKFSITDNAELDHFVAKWQPEYEKAMKDLGIPLDQPIWKLISKPNADSFIAWMNAYEGSSSDA